MEKLLQSLTEAERNAIQHVLDVDGDINSLTYKLMEHAYEAMQDTGNLQNADSVAEHLEDYYTTFVK